MNLRILMTVLMLWSQARCWKHKVHLTFGQGSVKGRFWGDFSVLYWRLGENFRFERFVFRFQVLKTCKEWCEENNWKILYNKIELEINKLETVKLPETADEDDDNDAEWRNFSRSVLS